MIPAKSDWNITRGDTNKRTVVWKDAQGGLVNLTDYDARLSVRTAPDAATTIVDLTVGDGIEIPGPQPLGQFDLAISPDKTAGLAETQNRFTYDFEVEDTVSGEVTTLFSGHLIVEPDVTRV